MTIRPACPSDLPRILAIYNHAVLTSTATYDLAPQSLEARQAWFAAKQQAGLPVFVAEKASEVAGFATYGPFRPWPGYRFTVEHSLYVAEEHRGRGIGQFLGRGALIAHALELGPDQFDGFGEA